MGNLERIVFIDRHIRERGGVRVAEIVGRFEVSERQAKRDLEYLRYRLGVLLEWDASKRAYHYTEVFPGLDFADAKALLGEQVRTNSESLLGSVARSGDSDWSEGVAISSIFNADTVTRIEPVPSIFCAR